MLYIMYKKQKVFTSSTEKYVLFSMTSIELDFKLKIIYIIFNYLLAMCKFPRPCSIPERYDIINKYIYIYVYDYFEYYNIEKSVRWSRKTNLECTSINVDKNRWDKIGLS